MAGREKIAQGPKQRIDICIYIGFELVGFNYLFSGFGETKCYPPYIIMILLSYSSSSIYLFFGATLTRNLELQ